MPQLEWVGAAPVANLSGPMTGSSTAFSVLDGTGYPTGSSHPFVVCIDRGLSNEEKILCSSRSANTFTVATSGRGYDGTAAQAHAETATVEHVLTASKLDELDKHAYDDLVVAHAAAKISYDNTTSGLAADQLQEAVDELAAVPKTFVFWIDGGGSVLLTGAKSGWLTIPFDCTLTKHRIVADVSGSVVLDVWRDTWANFPPTNADSITASAKPTLSSAQNVEDTTLTGWTVDLNAGDEVEVEVESATTIKKLKLVLFARLR